MKKKAKKKLTTFEKLSLVIEAVIAIAALIEAVKWW